MKTVYVMEHPAALRPSRSPQLRDVMDMDFRRLGKLLTGWRPKYEDDFRVLTTPDEVAQWLEKFKEIKEIALDLETDEWGRVDMLGMAASEKDAALMSLPAPEICSVFFEKVKTQQQFVIVHYGEGLELPWMLNVFGGKTIPISIHDTHKLFHAWDCEYASAGRDKDDKDEGGGSGALAFMQSLFTWRPYHKHLLGEAQSFEEKAHYCMLDCVVTWECFQRMKELCQNEQPKTWEAYCRDAVPLLPIMAQSSQRGWAIDTAKFEGRRGELRQLASTQADALVATYGDGICPKGKKAKTRISTAGLKTVLAAQGIKLPVEKRASGKFSPSLNREARQKLTGKHPELAQLTAYWETQDMLSDWYKKIADKEGVVHATWSGYLASWRWRCTQPNITQWPESERGVFKAREGKRLVQFDTQAGEYRWFAGECGDPGLLDLFRNYDRSGDFRFHPHVGNCAVLFGVDPETAAGWKGSADPHEKAKYVFAKNYIYRLLFSYRGGIDELRAAAAKSGLKFSRKDIEAFDKVWFARYPVAAGWRDRHVRMVLRSRLVTNREWGYIRRLHGQDEGKLSNIALNFVTQAGVAGIINRTVREVYQAQGLVPLANMHDGLVYEIDVGDDEEFDIREFVNLVKPTIERPLASINNMVIPVDVAVGDYWGKGMKAWCE